MKNNNKDYEISINIALDNAKKRINSLHNSDKLLRDDPII